MKKNHKFQIFILLISGIFLFSCDDPILVKKHEDGSSTYKIGMKSGESQAEAQARMFAKLECKDRKIISEKTEKELIEDKNTPMGQKPKKIELEFYFAQFSCAKPEDPKKEEKKDQPPVADTKKDNNVDLKNGKESGDTNLIDLQREDLPDELQRKQTLNGDEDPLELNRRAIALAKEQKYPEAISLFEKASMIQDFASAKTLNNLGYTEELAGNKEKAILYYRHSILRDSSIKPATENLGKLYYEAGNYREAIIYGERLLKLEPENQRVPVWLKDAYAKAEQQRSAGQYNKVEEFFQKDPRRRIISENAEPFFIQELGIETFQVLHGDKAAGKYFYPTQAGLLTIPASFFINFRPARNFSVEIKMGTPYLGLSHPGFIAGEQRLEFFYLFKSIYIGTGLLFSQANFEFDTIPQKGEFIHNADFPQASDTKFGVTFGANTENGDIRVVLYPRYLFRDFYDASRSLQFDRNFFEFEYAYRFDSILKTGDGSIGWPWRYYMKFRIDEYFISEYKIPSNNKNYGHYFGTYDLTLFGVDFGRLEIEGGKNKFTVGFEYTARLYFQDKDNADMTGVLNNQGWFGMNVSSALEGNVFPGFKSNSHILQANSRQSLFGHIILEENIGYEISGSAEAYHAMFANIKATYRFEKPRQQQAAEINKKQNTSAEKKEIKETK